MPRLVRNQTLNNLEDAVLDLQARLATEQLDESPAMGCCGCGTAMADVVTTPGPNAPRGETYCWDCVKRIGIPVEQIVRAFPGREFDR
jgi:hypothetical protein